jgi:hypothetical protein
MEKKMTPCFACKYMYADLDLEPCKSCRHAAEKAGQERHDSEDNCEQPTPKIQFPEIPSQK